MQFQEREIHPFKYNTTSLSNTVLHVGYVPTVFVLQIFKKKLFDTAYICLRYGPMIQI